MPSWIGPWEIAIVVVIALLIFGPRKLPELGQSLGKSITGFRKGLKDSQEELKSAINPEAAETTSEAVATQPAPAAPVQTAAVAPADAPAAAPAPAAPVETPAAVAAAAPAVTEVAAPAAPAGTTTVETPKAEVA